MKILTIGSAILDLFIKYDHPQLMAFDDEGEEVMYIILEEGTKKEVRKVLHATGGGGLNSAYCFKRLGFSAAPCAKIGSDEHGEFILNQLKADALDTSLIKITKKAPTGVSYILPSPTGNNVILVDRAANLTLSQKDIPTNRFSEFDHLYITSLSNQTAQLLPFITKHAKKHGVPVAANPGTSQLTADVSSLIESLADLDILILNTFETCLLAEQLFGKNKKPRKTIDRSLPALLSATISRDETCFILRDYFKAVHERGPKIAVVTNGKDGVYVSDGTQIIYHPSLPIEVESTVGAGDAFGATFVSQLLKKKSLENAIRAGIINAAAVLEHYDATSGLLNQKDLNELVAEIDPAGIKIFDL